MSWDTEFEALMVDTVSVGVFASWSTDGYSQPVYATATTYQARVVREQKLVRTFEGTEELSTITAWLNTTSTFGPLAEYKLPTSTGAGIVNLMSVDAYPDEDGVHHVKLRFA